MSRVLWFRRDLRIHDNPALVDAVEGAWADGDGNLVAVVLIDPMLWPTWGPAKQAYLIDSLRSLDESLGGNLVIRHGKAQDVIPAIAIAPPITRAMELLAITKSLPHFPLAASSL